MTPLGGTVLAVPTDEGWREVEFREPRDWARRPDGFSSRRAFAAAHVVADPLGGNAIGAPAAIDWEETLAFRRHLFDFGFGIAEAMDTAQRNMGLDYGAVAELVRRSAAQARELGAGIASGAGTDQLDGPAANLDEVVAAYLEQVEMVESAGSRVVLMASRHLAELGRSPHDYQDVYGRVLSQVSEPVILHWLGEVFDPSLAGYWGSSDLEQATASFLEVVRTHHTHVDGVKVSLLSADHEVALRAALPPGVRLYTGDDFNYPSLIRGDGEHHSDALLGAFAAIAPAASEALAALDDGDLVTYDAEMERTLALSRTLFEAPTYHYKTGIAFLAWVRGLQTGFSMVGGAQSARSLTHLGRVLMLANEARLLPDPELAAARFRLLLDAAGARP